MQEENRRVTIKDIAEEIGVSTATVSNVIHGKTKKISDRTVAKVQEKLQESGYIPNMAAVLLAQNSSKIVCVMISDHEKYEGKMLEDPFVAQMLNSISKELSEYGYFMMIKEEPDVEKIAAYASMWNMAGLIIMGYCSLDYEKLRSKMHIPFVVVDSYDRNIKSYIDIGVDNIEGGRLAGKYLLSKGHREILYFADNKEDCDLDRYNGLKDVMGESVYYLVSIDKKNRLHPFYIVYISQEGEVIVNHLSPKELLDKFRSLCKGKAEPDKELCKAFNSETKDGLKMQKYSELLGSAISSIITVKEESDIDSFLGGCQGELFTKEIRGLDDFELICFLVVR